MEENSLWKQERQFEVFPCDKAGKAPARKHHSPGG